MIGHIVQSGIPLPWSHPHCCTIDVESVSSFSIDLSWPFRVLFKAPAYPVARSVSLFDLGARFFVPPRAAAGTPRAAAVKAGRRGASAALSAVAKPRLDGGEHGVRLRTVG